MSRRLPVHDTTVPGLADLAATDALCPSVPAQSHASVRRPDALDKIMLALTIGVWAWQYLLVVILFYLTSGRDSDPATLAMRAIGDGTGIAACLGLYVLLRHGGERRPWALLLKCAAWSLPLSVALAVTCQVGARLTSFYRYHPENWMDPYLLIWGSFDYLWVLLTWSALLVGVTITFEVRKRDRQLVAMREAAQQAQLLALRAQINPHFLLNTFNTLAGLISVGRKEASEHVVLNLSHFLRHTLTRTPSELIPLNDEVAMLRRYLEIEEARFGSRLSIDYDIAPGCERALVPALILLPLAENSIKYALARSEDGIEVRVGARHEDGMLVLWLEDECRGLAADAASYHGLGIGLSNLRQQLEALYGNDAALAAGPTGHGWRNRLRIPWQESAT